MKKTIFVEKQDNLVLCINNQRHIYLVLWGETLIEDERGKQWQYSVARVEYVPTLGAIKDVVLNGINAETDERITNGFIWNGVRVWLSAENQFNFKAAYDIALQSGGQNLPVKFKLGEYAGEPVYHTFETLTELRDFYISAIAYINECLNEGWQEKDSVDWSRYQL